MQKTIKFHLPDFQAILKFLIIPIITFLMYTGTFLTIVSSYIPTGVNDQFVRRSFFYGLIILGIAVFLEISRFILQKNKKMSFKAVFQNLAATDFFLLLLPIVPVAQYLIINQKYIPLSDSIVVLGFFAAFSGIYLLLVPVLLSSISSKRVLTCMGMAYLFTLLNMASLSRYFSWYNRGSMRIQALHFLVVFVLTWLLLGIRNKRDFALVIILYTSVSILIQFQSQATPTTKSLTPIDNNPLSALINGRYPVENHNVYLMVYDAYAPTQTMQSYGIDNSSQELFLKGNGFVLYPHNYSIGPSTLDTMNTVLNLADSDFGFVKRAVSGDGVIQNAFRGIGYQTYGIFPNDYMFRGIKPSYDHVIPERSTPAYIYMISSILMGEFRFDLWFDIYSHDQFQILKENALAKASAQNMFVYSHTNFPSHSQNSGKCLPDEKQQYQARLVVANGEMRQDIETIIQNDPQAIIIVAGDHGPYLTKNCVTLANEFPISSVDRLDIQDRYGSFLAIRWPTTDYKKYDQIEILQDVFPAVFSYLYQDPEFLKLKLEPTTLRPGTVSGVVVEQGIIEGGIDDGEPLFNP